MRRGSILINRAARLTSKSDFTIQSRQNFLAAD
jgi:hypothetical protein